MKIPFLDLQRQYKTIKEKVDVAIQRVVDSQMFLLGGELKAFEEKFGEYLGIRYVVGVNSGTDGLILALRALEIGVGDEVITPANSFIATTLAIVTVGATPVLVDCDPDSYQIDITEVEKKITKKTKAILPVHLYGAPCDVATLRKIADRHNIYLVEDAAQAHGATIGEKKVGTFGDISVFSFYPGKNLGAYGDAGALATNSKKIYEKLLKLRNYGQTKKYYHEEIGYNSRLDEIQASLLSVKLQYLNRWNKQRNRIASLYKKGLLFSSYQKIMDTYHSCYHLFVIESRRRDALQQFLNKKGIHTLIHYPIPIHMQPCFSFLGYKKGDFLIAERLANTILSLPIYAELTDKEVQYICKNVNEFEKQEER